MVGGNLMEYKAAKNGLGKGPRIGIEIDMSTVPTRRMLLQKP